VAFSWQLLLNRIPTKANLAIRSVLPIGALEDCVLRANGGNFFSSFLTLSSDF